MRIFRPKPKIQREVGIPQELQAFLRQVEAKILARDDEATILSDDLMQAEVVYGGLIDEGGDRYGFTYFPNPNSKGRWEIELNVVEISAIASGTTTTLKLWGCVSENCKYLSSDERATCFYCDYEEEQPKLPSEIYDDKMRWGREFFSLNPEACGFHIREVVQQDPMLSQKYVDYTGDEIDELMNRHRES